MRWLRVVLVLVGLGFGVTGVIFLLPALPNTSDVVTFGLWFLIPPILSDAVLMPAIAVGGFMVGRVLPGWLRTPVIVALIVSAAVIAVALPFIGRPGLRPDNASLLDRNYPLGLALYLVVVWAAAIGWAIIRRTRLGRSVTPRAGGSAGPLTAR